jgi:hypothetical protein
MSWYNGTDDSVSGTNTQTVINSIYEATAGKNILAIVMFGRYPRISTPSYAAQGSNPTDDQFTFNDSVAFCGWYYPNRLNNIRGRDSYDWAEQVNTDRRNSLTEADRANQIFWNNEFHPTNSPLAGSNTYEHGADLWAKIQPSALANTKVFPTFYIPYDEFTAGDRLTTL